MKRKALITGASRGIGKAIAERLACENIDLVLTCNKNLEKLQNIAFDLASQNNIECRAYSVDAGDYKNVEKLFNIEKDFDIVINNAGISYIGLIQDMTCDEWRDVMSTNLDSAFYTCKFAIPYMVSKQEGTIVNISSMWGNVGASTEVAYSASKGGLNAFTKALAKELAPSNISVNAIACGVIDTDMNKCFDEQERVELEESIPVGRYGTPDEIAEVVWNIIRSPKYMTGQIISVDGGLI